MSVRLVGCSVPITWFWTSGLAARFLDVFDVRLVICIVVLTCISYTSPALLVLILQVWDAITSGTAVEDTSLLCRFFLITFAVS